MVVHDNLVTGNTRIITSSPLTATTYMLAIVGSGTTLTVGPGMIIKLNSVVDPACIEALYRASQAGVRVDLLIRGICSLVPGLPGLSEGIRVRSIVGQYLEHSRVFQFVNGGRPEWYIGSADLMERNLDRRVEAVVPIEDPEAQQRIRSIREVMLADDRRSWQMQADGAYHRTEDLNGAPGTLDTFEILKARAQASVSDEATEPRRPHAGTGSLDPRA